MEKRNQMWRKLGIAGIAGVMLMSTQAAIPYNVLAAEATPAVHAAQQTYQLKLLQEEILTSGAKLLTYQYMMPRTNETATAIGKVIAVDLTNPHVKLDVMTGDAGQVAKRDTVLGMTKETKAVAGVNGDFFNTSGEFSPLGPSVQGGQLVTSPDFRQYEGMYTFGLTTSNHPIIDYYAFDGKVTAPTGQSLAVSGVNKSVYWYNVNGKATHSHANRIYMYTSAWGSENRGNDGATTPTEMLVRNGVVEAIAEKSTIPGLVPADGYILRASGTAAEFLTQNFKVGDKVWLQTRFVSSNPQNALNYTEFKMMIGGHTLLVEDGKPSAYTKDVSSLGGDRSRTAIGYSKDRKTAYLVTVTNNELSSGMTLKELQKFMIDIGVYKGMNLDGGGSTQIAARPLGEFDPVLATETEYGTQRLVVNGVGVYSTAPQGEVEGFLINGEPVLFIGESSDYTLRAYDEYYNPMDVSTLQPIWKVSSGQGAMNGNVFTATQAGESIITVNAGKAVQNKTLKVVGRNDVNELTVEIGHHALFEGNSFQAEVYAVTKDGLKRQVPPNLVDWEFIGFKGRVDGDTIHVDQVNQTATGYLIARYDGFSTMATLPTAVTRTFTSFANAPFTVATAASHPDVTGTARIATGLSENPSDSVLAIDYDFTLGTGTKAVYATFNEDRGLAVDGQPIQMKLELKADNSLNWVRAQIVDAAGKSHLVSLTENMNWTGWDTVSADLTDYDMQYPITLKRLYVANPEQGQDEREAVGSIAIDDISFQYQLQAPEQSKPKVKFVINQKTMLLDGVEHPLDQAPIIYQDTTMVPIKFIVDALGGQAWWDQNEKKVSILRGDQYTELWVDQNDFIVNGLRKLTQVPPQVMNGRTLVPIRLVSETLGWKVIWNQQEKSVTLE